MQSALRCGVSGWSHPDWNSVIYPPVKPRGFHPLEYLSQHLDLVQIDASFHRPLRPDLSKLWIGKVRQHPDFMFSVVLVPRVTHDRPLEPPLLRKLKDDLRPPPNPGTSH